MTPEQINNLATTIYEQNKAVGWWDDPDRCVFTCLQLVNTEIAEATEGARKNLMDDHLPHRKMEEVEIADAMIRMLDLAGRYEWTYDPDVPRGLGYFPDVYKDGDEAKWSVPKWHLFLTLQVGDAAIELDVHGSKSDRLLDAYSAFILMCIEMAGEHNYDLEGAIHEKLAYNAQRSDHKRENRAADGGKKF